MRGATDGITSTEQTINGHHTVIAPEVFFRGQIFRSAAPCSRAGCVGAHYIRFGCSQLRIDVFGVNVLRCPDNRLADGHTEEIFPAYFFKMRILKGFLGNHVYRTTARFYFLNKGMVTQAGGRWVVINILTNHGLGVVIPGGLVFVSIGILGVGLQMQEVSANRSIAIFETTQYDTVFHLCHLGAGLNRQRVG